MAQVLIHRQIAHRATPVSQSRIDRLALERHGLDTDPDIQTSNVGGALSGWDSVLDGVKLLEDHDVPDATALVCSTTERRFYDGLKDGDGHYLEPPPRVRNLPIFSSSKVPGTGTRSMFLGLWPDYFVGTRAEFRVELLKEMYASTHQCGLLCHLRMDAGTVRPNSFMKLSGITG